MLENMHANIHKRLKRMFIKWDQNVYLKLLHIGDMVSYNV